MIEMESKKPIWRINKTKSWFFEGINRINKTLAKLTKRKKGNTQINKIKWKRGYYKTHITEIQRIISEYFENSCSNKLEKWANS
jgi:hypothetical protein